MLEKVRVCCFCETWKNGGIEGFLRNMLTRLDAERFETDVAVVKLSENIFSDEMKKKGIRFVEISGVSDFKRLLAERQYDVVHLNVYQAFSLRYAKAARQSGVRKIIAHSHNTALRSSATKALKLALHNLSKHLYGGYVTDFWACSGDAARFLFAKKHAEKFRFIPNGIDTEKFRFDRSARESFRREKQLDGYFLIGCVGRLCEQKNQTFLLDVLKEALKLNGKCRLLLIGEGEDENALRQKAERLGISESVVFYGVSSEVNRIMCALDVLAVPSLFEGLVIVAMEAQCAGLPTVCSENNPEEALITDVIRRVSLSEGAEKWARSLLDANGADRDPEGSIESVKRAGFDVEDCAKMIEELYGNI